MTKIVDWENNDGNSRGQGGGDFVLTWKEYKTDNSQNRKTQLNVILVTD